MVICNEGLKIGMLDSWFNITEKNQRHQMHIHPHHTVSGVYYHQMKKEMGGIIKRLMAQNHKVFLSPLFILIDLKRKII